MQYNQPYDQASNPNAPYVNGNPAAGVQGSIIPGAAVEYPQRELVALIQDAGLTPSNGDLSQAAKAIQSGKLNYAVAGGSANALTATLTPAPDALTAGLRCLLLISTANTTAATLNVNTLGAKPITRVGGADLQANDLVPGLAEVSYDGTQFELLRIGPGSSVARNVQIFNVAGTFSFTVPAGIYWLYPECYGAGGGGAIQNIGTGSAHGEGGGGGGCALGWIAVVPGQVITIIVGAAGSNNLTGGNGTGGGTSSVGAYMSATGGTGATNGGSPGAGGMGIGGQINLVGEPGFDGNDAALSIPASGGNAAGPLGGKGGRVMGTPGPIATWPGGGGGVQALGAAMTEAPPNVGGVILRW
ncbi:glycine-rich domain-containing protein [Rhizobium sp. No.120]